MPPIASQSISWARCSRIERLRPGLQRHFDQPLRIGRIGRADNHEQITAGRCLLDRFLAVGGGIADRFRRWRGDLGKALIEPLDHVSGVIDRQGRLGDKAKCGRIFGLEGIDVLDGFDKRHSAGRQLPHGADDLGVTLVADQHDMPAQPFMAHGLLVHLGDQRTGGIEIEQVAGFGVGRHRLGTPWAEKITGWA
jgi:hypothetical protein